MMHKYSKIVRKVLETADIILIVLDARQPDASSNRDIARRIESLGKKHIFVINKVDLVSKQDQAKLNLPNSVEVSSQSHIGTLRLYRKIMELAKGEKVLVGVVGYPNTGKSTLINTLKGKHIARTSSVSGFTKGVQKIALNDKIMLLDTPGVLQNYGSDNTSLHMIGAVDVNKIRDPLTAALDIVDRMDGRVEGYFQVEKHADAMETMEQIALKKNLLLKGGLPDTVRAAKETIRLVQIGRIR